MTINPCFEDKSELVVVAIGLLKKLSIAAQAAMYIVGGKDGEVTIALPDTNEGRAILVLVEKVMGKEHRIADFKYNVNKGGLVCRTDTHSIKVTAEEGISAVAIDFDKRTQDHCVKFYVPEAVQENCGGTMIFGGKVHHSDGSAESFAPLGIGPALVDE